MAVNETSPAIDPLIDSMSDDPDYDAVILMFETGDDIPPHTPYAYSYQIGGGGSGSIIAPSSRERPVNTGVIRLTANRGWRLSDEGKRFAEWLIQKGRRCDIFWTPVGGWGDPDPETERGRPFLRLKEGTEDWHSRSLRQIAVHAGVKQDGTTKGPPKNSAPENRKSADGTGQ